MKNKPKKSVRDPLVQELITALRKKGVRCGTGDQMVELRKTK
jgi:hypothetical protein